ncbi:MAG TPA: hypothetical protein VGQ03_11235 [Nitrososphaera sp.]|jgi:hypothetical protein|nr:hypothetical protein [Nitrososphaera sp.]
MPARRDGTSLEANLIMTFDPFIEMPTLSPLFGRVETSAASASQTELAIRLDWAEITISAAKFVEVNVVCA